LNFSYWEYKHLWKSWDFVIVGSGITGLTSAIFLKRRFPLAGIAILEKGLLPTGASTKNAGFACFGSVSEILDDLDTQPEKAVFTLIEKRYKGLALLRQLLGDANLSYEPSGGYEIFLPEEYVTYRKCLGSLSYLNAEMVNAIGKQVFWDARSKIDSFGFSKVSNMLENKEEGMIDTGLMMKNLVKLARQEGVEIFNGITVNGVDTGGNNPTLMTEFGDVKARKVLVATNGFARTLLPSVGVRPCRAQVLVTSPIPGLKVQGAFHHDRGYNYFRNIDGRILLGGGRQTDMETENTDVMETTSTIQTYLENLLSEIIIPDRNYTIDYRWSGIMGMGDSKDVIVKELNPGLFCAVRFGGMGVALGSYIGKEVSEMMAD